MTTPPGQRYRPASPITFAPDPRRRPISPILFAKGAKGKEKEKKVRAKSAGLETEEDGTRTPSADDTPTLSPVDGYEEDDEWDTADDGGSLDEKDLYSPSPPPPLPVPPVLPLLPPPTLPQPPNSGKWAKFNTSHNAYTLMRFSTGQILEDDLALTWYDLAPYELIELHAHTDVCIVPSNWATGASKTSGPLATVSEHGHGGHHQHHRTTSMYSLALGPTSSSHTETHHARVYLPPLNRTLLPKYIQPYWEGHVRALCVVSRPLDMPIANFANGYGYGYGGVGNAFVDSRAMALGIGQPPAFGSHQLGKDYGGMRGAGGWDSKVGGPGATSGLGQGQKTFEWRMRWVVIREGVLSLCKGRDVSFVDPLVLLWSIELTLSCTGPNPNTCPSVDVSHHTSRS